LIRALTAYGTVKSTNEEALELISQVRRGREEGGERRRREEEGGRRKRCRHYQYCRHY